MSCSVVFRGVGLGNDRPTVYVEGNAGCKRTYVQSPTRTERRAYGGRNIGEYLGDGSWEWRGGFYRDFGYICFRSLLGRENRLIGTGEPTYLFPSVLLGERHSRLSTGPNCIEPRLTSARRTGMVWLIEASSGRDSFGQLDPPPPERTRLLSTPPRWQSCALSEVGKA